MRVSIRSALGLALATTFVVPPAVAGPSPAPPPSESDRGDTLNAAAKAWEAGEYAEVKRLLEPIAARPIEDPVEREKVLTFLADATIADTSVDEEIRREATTVYINTLLDADPSWEMKRDIFTPELYELYRDIRDQRERTVGQACRGDLTACRADLTAVQSELKAERAAHEELKANYEEQDVVVLTRERRSRALAIFPLGLSHFLNGERGLGAGFLVAETVIGAAGLGLLIQRVVVGGCRRTAGFQAGSLECDPRGNTTQQDIVRWRQAEEAMGWLFISSILLDIAIAQIRFKPFEVVEERSVKRKDLDKEDGSSPGNPEKKRKVGKRKRRAKVRPAPAVIPGGAGAALRVRF